MGFIRSRRAKIKSFAGRPCPQIRLLFIACKTKGRRNEKDRKQNAFGLVKIAALNHQCFYRLTGVLMRRLWDKGLIQLQQFWQEP